jgi:SAM-dependent methyltransferase
MSWTTPARRRGVEILDDPATPEDVRRTSMHDVTRANALFGGSRAALRAIARVLPSLPRDAVLLDVGTGLADIPRSARVAASRAGVSLTTIGLDAAQSLVRSARDRLDAGVTGDALRLPIDDDSADVVLCSQLLHHFTEPDARALIAELHRVSRGWVIVSDLRRSWLAAGGFWLASVALRFHPVTRHDGVTSVLRGFTGRELESLVRDATGDVPAIESGAGWRVTATWRKQSGPVR